MNAKLAYATTLALAVSAACLAQPAPQAPPDSKPAPVRADDVPDAANKIVKAHDKEVEDLKYKLEQDIKLAKEKMLDRLDKLAKELDKGGKAGDARQIRAHIEALKKGPVVVANVLPDPGSLGAYRGKNGQVFHFRVTGGNTGTVWGTDIYTDDSALAAAAVHAGLLTAGQTGVIKVTIVEAQTSYTGSTRNGITTNNYGSWGGSYKIERP